MTFSLRKYWYWTRFSTVFFSWLLATLILVCKWPDMKMTRYKTSILWGMIQLNIHIWIRIQRSKCRFKNEQIRRVKKTLKFHNLVYPRLSINFLSENSSSAYFATLLEIEWNAEAQTITSSNSRLRFKNYLKRDLFLIGALIRLTW